MALFIVDVGQEGLQWWPAITAEGLKDKLLRDNHSLHTGEQTLEGARTVGSVEVIVFHML